MISMNQSGEPNFVAPNKILNEIKFLHKEMPSFCYSWVWEAKCVSAMEKEDFLEQIIELKSVGCVRRCEVYAKQPVMIGKNKLFVRLVSYGSPNAKRMLLGPSNLAHAFDKLMFDYVFVFLEKEQSSRKRMKLILEKAVKKDDQKLIEQIKNSMQNLLQLTSEEIDEIINIVQQ